MTIQLMQDFRFSQKPLQFTDAQAAHSSRSRLAQAFANRLYLSDGGAFLITGYRGVGKTTFVNDVLRRLKHNLEQGRKAQDQSPPLLLDVCLNIARPLSGVELMHFILRQLHNRLEDLDLLRRLPKALRNQLRLAFLRTSAMLALNNSQETEAGMSLDKWLSFSSKVTVGSSRDINYLAYDERSAENDLIALAQQLSQGFKPAGFGGLSAMFGGTMRLKLLFVFDELDKIDEARGSESALTDILHALKTLFTTSGISFIFVAGRALQERWQQDVQSGDSVYESVFSELRYLPAVWDQVDELCDPFLAAPDRLSDYDRLLYNDFKRYLAYTGRGIPRRILRGFYERVRWDGEQITLALTDNDRRQMRFHAELYQLLAQSEDSILGENSRDIRPEWLDKQRLGMYYIVDWVLARGTNAFTLAEVIDSATNELKAGIAPARELTPRVVTGLLEILCTHHYVEKFTNINETLFNKPGITQPREQFRLVMRRLIEMGCYRDAETAANASADIRILSDRYQLMEMLGQGASAQVHRALDRLSGRIVAVKLFNADFFSADSTLQERLRAEVAVQTRLRHTGIAELLDTGHDNGMPFIVMEYIEGVTLNRMLEDQGSLPLPEAMAITRALLDTLHYLHNHGVIWRDVKPSNILITLQGRIVIVDFGTAQTVQNAQAGPDTTRTGFTVGTPAYMSPEQVRGEAQTAASDLFSVGVILFEMLTGEKPWPVSNPLELYRLLQTGNVDNLPAFQRLPAVLQPYLRRALSIHPGERFQRAQDMLEALPHTAPDTQLIQRVMSAREAGDSAGLTGKFATQTMRAPDADVLSALSGAAAVATPPSPMPDPTSTSTSAPSVLSPRASSAPAASASASSPAAAAADAMPAPPASAPAPAAAAPAKTGDGAGHAATEFSTPLRVAVEINPSQMTYPRSYALLTLNEPQGTRYFGLFGNKVTLGRAQDCDIHLNDAAASRYHACLIREGNSYRVEDMNSSNGLQVNGQRIYQRGTLADRDRISIGKTELLLELPQTPVTKTVTDVVTEQLAEDVIGMVKRPN